MITPSACSEVVAAYDRQGWHRTATTVDNESAEWLVAELNSRGVHGQVQAFPFRRVDANPCRVWAGDWETTGQAMPDGLLPPLGVTVTGTFADSPGPGRIALARMDQHGQNSVLDKMRNEPWDAIVAVIEGTPTGLTVRNAWYYENPGGPPIVQVAAPAWEHLSALKSRGESINLECGAARADVTAANVVARVAGTQPGLPAIVVLTPRSGWWHCAGERGGGIAAWLEVAREVRAAPLKRDVVFLATTGHELNFLGIRRYLDYDPALAKAAMLWVHLGANVGAADSPTIVRAAEPGLIDAVNAVDRESLGSAINPECQILSRPAGGEAMVVSEAGGRYVSMVGKGFALFHSTEDRWPQGIDADAIAMNARLVDGLIRRVDSE